MLNQSGGGCIRPVEILESQDDRLFGAEPLDEFGESTKQEIALPFRWYLEWGRNIGQGEPYSRGQTPDLGSQRSQVVLQ